ncbi:unnamed protein product [Leptidea sinapis]|uniref:Uncharacterized protein n=1 Tax=Leptidea sinapis TaxID=189913 RepID=A0A5E4QRG4_9NEOP|nr:unnamed protein product [Leptidea sinapis]
MIAASEPLEFVPHGRTVLAKHPGQIYGKNHNVSASENSLLYKLTNFGIKDDSILDVKEEEQEWWMIRQVYYKTQDITEPEPDAPKESKYEFESFRPPSRLKPDFNISIKSELMSGVKKEDAGFGGTSRGGSANSSRLVSTPATKTSAPEQRETIACYTIENPIKHAVFADFHIDINNTMLIDALNTQIGDTKKNIKIDDNTEHIPGKIMPSLVLVDSKCMRVYALDGREYITSIPFQVKKVWPMKYGVLLEKDTFTPSNISLLKFNESHNSTFSKSKTFPFNMSARLRAESISGYDQDCPLPTCFSVAHPLDEVTPVLMKSPSQGLQYYNDTDLQIIFVSTSPSIILLYDWKLGTHSLWNIRKSTRDECLNMCQNINSTTTVFSQSCDFVGSPMHNVTKNLNSWTGSPFHSKKSPATPTRSKQNSPMANIFHQQGLSPHTSIGQASSTSVMPNTMAQVPPCLPLYPDVCIDHIFTDSQVIRRDRVKNPSDIKSFLHTDLIGHEYLCYMVKVDGVSKLQIMRLKKSHSNIQTNRSNIIVGWVSCVLAKDAVVLDHLKMIALIDEAGNIVLRSGNNFVGKRNTFQSPFPRRSSLLPTRCEPNTFDDSALHLLSPVPHSSATRIEHKETLGITCLLYNKPAFYCCYLNRSGQTYRIALPAAPHDAAPLLRAARRALAATLPHDLAAQVIIKWYGVRNAPGTQDFTPEDEWELFSNLLLSLIGYDVDRLSPSKTDEEHSEVVTKKQRTSNDGSQDDWEYLLNSKMHKAIGHSLSHVLNLPAVATDNQRAKTKNRNTEKSLQINTNALLFPYMIHIFYAFHLVYEDFKMNTLLDADMKLLIKFLHQIARDLGLDKYLNHYWMDFPTEINLDDDDAEHVSEVVMKSLVQPNYFSAEPPNIFSYLYGILREADVGYYPYMSQVNDLTKDMIESLQVGASAGLAERRVPPHHEGRPRPAGGDAGEDQSAIPVTINLTQRPEVSDHDFIEEQEKHLFAISIRTMALPVGSGTVRDGAGPSSPLLDRVAECGGLLPARAAVALLPQRRGSRPGARTLPWFHHRRRLDRLQQAQGEPASGRNHSKQWEPPLYRMVELLESLCQKHYVLLRFLLALGLNGHLKDMPFMNIYEYLVKSHEMTSIGLLLGLAATYRGTMDVQATKVLSIHVEALLPPTCVELDIQQGIQVAALLGVGLLYQGTAHAHYSQVLLNEIGYQRDQYSSSSRDGSAANLDVTSPGATLALGLIYMQSNNPALAEWLRPPDTPYMLDYVRPDLLMLRVIARGLVLWDSIEPSQEWVESLVPATIRPYCFVKPTEENIDYEAMKYHLQAFRHLYVLAVEPRLILPRDIDSGKLCYANVQRAGCLSYLDDPQGYLTILAQTLTLDKTNVWSATADNIELFTNDAKVQNFVRHYLTKQMYIGANQYNGANCADCLVMKKRRGVKGEVARGACLCRKYTREEREHVQSLSVLTYECVIIKKMKTEPTSYHMWQVKLLVAQAELVNARAALTMAVDDDTPADTLVSTEFTLAVKQKITLVFDKWETRILPYLRKYLGLPSSRKIHTSDDETKRILASYLVYHDLPRDVLREDTDEMGVVLCEGRGVGASSGAAVGKVIELLR